MQKQKKRKEIDDKCSCTRTCSNIVNLLYTINFSNWNITLELTTIASHQKMHFVSPNKILLRSNESCLSLEERIFVLKVSHKMYCFPHQDKKILSERLRN